MSKLFKTYDVECVGDFILVRRDIVEEKTEGGLYVPQSSQGESLMAEVLAIGPGKIDSNGNRIEPQVRVGDRVLMDPISGIPLELEGEKFRCCREGELVAIVRDK